MNRLSRQIVSFASLLSFLSLAGCHSNPPTALTTLNPSVSLAGRIQGTWRTIVYPSKKSYLAFDSASGRFMQQLDYAYEFTRELPGTFSISDSILTITHDIGSRYTFACFFRGDSLFLNNVEYPDETLGPYVRTSILATLDGWSTKISPSSHHLFPPETIWSLGVGDSGVFVLAYSWADSVQHILKIDTTLGLISTSVVAKNVRGLDSHAKDIWTVTYSTLQKRSTADLSVTDSLNWRSKVTSLTDDYFPTGLAVDDNAFFVIVVTSASVDGYLLQFALDGSFMRATKTYGTIGDLCLVNGRLFCCAGFSETFWELDPVSGLALNYFSLEGQPSFVHIEGAAFSNGNLYVVDNWTYLKLYTCEVPRLSMTRRPANQSLNLTARALVLTRHAQAEMHQY